MNAAKLLDMFEMQDKMNRYINPNWVKANYTWLRAVVVECGELMDHIGWKWWKSQLCDTAQCKLELVDLWHFGLSYYMSGELPEDEAEKLAWLTDAARSAEDAGYFDESEGPRVDNKEEALEMVEELLEAALSGIFYIKGFFSLCRYFGMSTDELYSLYVAKNTLNIFRQDHGYKDGTYTKIWYDGQEDNVHLTAIVEKTDGHFTFDWLYGELEKRYGETVAGV